MSARPIMTDQGPCLLIPIRLQTFIALCRDLAGQDAFECWNADAETYYNGECGEEILDDAKVGFVSTIADNDSSIVELPL